MIPRTCRRCGQPIAAWKKRDAVFCSFKCRDRARHQRQTLARGATLRARRAAPPPPIERPTKSCQRCGLEFVGRPGQKYCCKRCSNAAAVARQRRRRGRARHREQRACVVCGATYTSVRSHQRYCGRVCRTYSKNKNRIDKNRKTDADPHVSPELIARRAAVIRAQRLEKKRDGGKPLGQQPPSTTDLAWL